MRRKIIKNGRNGRGSKMIDGGEFINIYMEMSRRRNMIFFRMMLICLCSSKRNESYV